MEIDESTKQVSRVEPTPADGVVPPMTTSDLEDSLRKWVSFVEQDSTAQAVQYLDECNTQTWGE